MSEITRRQALGHLATAFAAGAAIDHWLAADVHAQLRSAGATSVPKALSPQQFRTLERLTDLIIPVENGKPGALQAGVPALDRRAAQRERGSQIALRDGPRLARRDDDDRNAEPPSSARRRRNRRRCST